MTNFFKVTILRFSNFFQSSKSFQLLEVFLASNFQSLTHSLIHSFYFLGFKGHVFHVAFLCLLYVGLTLHPTDVSLF